MDQFLQSLIPHIEHFRSLGYWIVFLAAFLESLAFVGLFVPGTVIIVFAGFLATKGLLDLGDLMWFAVAGAILGDQLSFYLGRSKGHVLVKKFKESTIAKAETYFQKHGKKSVVLGRFIGTIRAFIPFIAGLLGMRAWSFLVLNIISAVIWSLAYLLLGYFLGAAWQTIEVWSTRVGFVAILFVAAVLLLYLLYKKLKHFLVEIKPVLFELWGEVKKNPTIKGWAQRHGKPLNFVKERFSLKKFTGLTLTVLIASFLCVLAFFTGIVEDFLSSDPIVQVDANIAHFLVLFRTPVLTDIFTWISFLANTVQVLVISFLLTGLFFVLKQKNWMVGLWLSVVGGGGWMFLGKHLFERARPDVPLILEDSYSFPSGHSTLVVALYGFIAYWLCKRATKTSHKLAVILSTLVIIFSVGLSRIYLGVHYLSDVWSGFLLGTLCLIVGIGVTEYLESRFPSKSNEHSHVLLKVFVFSLATASYLLLGFAGEEAPAPTTVALETIESNKISEKLKQESLEYAETLYGSEEQPLSFIFVGDEEHLKSTLEDLGWQSSFAITLSFWNNRPADFSFSQSSSYIKIWETHFELADGSQVFVATTGAYTGYKWNFIPLKEKDLNQSREELASELTGTQTLNMQEINLVESFLGKDLTGQEVFSDGQAYLVYPKKVGL